jgi:hypothetical protein
MRPELLGCHFRQAQGDQPVADGQTLANPGRPPLGAIDEAKIPTEQWLNKAQQMVQQSYSQRWGPDGSVICDICPFLCD